MFKDTRSVLEMEVHIFESSSKRGCEGMNLFVVLTVVAIL